MKDSNPFVSCRVGVKMRWMPITLPAIQHEKHGGKRTVLEESHGSSLLCVIFRQPCFLGQQLLLFELSLPWAQSSPGQDTTSLSAPFLLSCSVGKHSILAVQTQWAALCRDIPSRGMKRKGRDLNTTGVSQASLGLLPLYYTQSSVCPSHGWEMARYTWKENKVLCKLSEQLPVQVMLLLLCNKKSGGVQ